MEEHLTKKERIEQKKLDKIANMEHSGGSSKMKAIVIGLVALIFLVGLTYAIFATKKKSTEPVTISSSGWVKGNAESTITLTEFADFQCPACRAFEPMLSQLDKEYGDRVKIVFKHFPLKAIHPNALPAAVAAEAAGKQNKFWEFHDVLYEKQDEWAGEANPKPKFLSYAKGLKLDTAQFEKDLNDSKIKAAVNAQVDEGIKIGVSGTPSLFINGTPIDIPGNYEVLKLQIESMLPNASPSAK